MCFVHFSLALTLFLNSNNTCSLVRVKHQVVNLCKTTVDLQFAVFQMYRDLQIRPEDKTFGTER